MDIKLKDRTKQDLLNPEAYTSKYIVRLSETSPDKSINAFGKVPALLKPKLSYILIAARL